MQYYSRLDIIPHFGQYYSHLDSITHVWIVLCNKRLHLLNLNVIGMTKFFNYCHVFSFLVRMVLVRWQVLMHLSFANCWTKCDILTLLPGTMFHQGLKDIGKIDYKQMNESSISGKEQVPAIKDVSLSVEAKLTDDKCTVDINSVSRAPMMPIMLIDHSGMMRVD